MRKRKNPRAKLSYRISMWFYYLTWEKVKNFLLEGLAAIALFILIFIIPAFFC